MERQFFSGNTLEQAVLAAGRHYDLDPERVAYKLRDKKHGFLNIRRRFVIEVDPASPERPVGTGVERDASAIVAGEHEPECSNTEDQDRRHREAPPRRREAPSWVGSDLGDRDLGDSDREDSETYDDIEAVENAVVELSKLIERDLVLSVQRGERYLNVELSGPESTVLREEGGDGLGAIEHLLPRMARGLSGHSVPCRVDSEGFRAAQEEELRRLARSVAEEVRSERRGKRLELMNPAERRLVHLALVDDPTVRTESEGNGFLKRVKIMPS